MSGLCTKKMSGFALVAVFSTSFFTLSQTQGFLEGQIL
jgi:hypothetical protein